MGFVRSLDPEGTLRVHAEAGRRPGRPSVSRAAGASGEANFERLFHLPHGDERGEELFLARVGIESEGGRLQLAEREGRIVALLSWPRPAPAANPGAPA